MSLSLDFTNAASFQSYVQDYYPELIGRLFMDFDSANHCTPHEGVKGKKLITELVLADLVRRYTSTFNVVVGTHVFENRNLEVADAKVDLSIVPKDFEGSYLGAMRRKGQDSMDLPFEGYILQKTLSRVSQEQEIAFHQAVAAGSPASTDKLIALFDGTKQILTDEIGNLSPVTTGVLTASNAFTSIELIFESIGSQYQKAGIECFISPKTNLLAGRQYRNDYGKYTGDKSNERDWGVPGLNVVVLPGFPDDCILITPEENIHYGYDGLMDSGMFNFEQEDRKMKFWMDFKMGVQFGIIHPDLVGVNEQIAL